MLSYSKRSQEQWHSNKSNTKVGSSRLPGHTIPPLGSQRLPPHFHISLFASSSVLFPCSVPKLELDLVVVPWYQTFQSAGVATATGLWALTNSFSGPLFKDFTPATWWQASAHLHDLFNPGTSTTVASHSPIVFLGFSWCQASAALHGLFMPSEKQYHVSDCYILTASAASMRCSFGPL